MAFPKAGKWDTCGKKICYANSKGFLQAHHKNINWAEVIVYVARQA